MARSLLFNTPYMHKKIIPALYPSYCIAQDIQF